MPGVERMPKLDEDELFVWLVNEHRDYAFEWDGGREEELRREVERWGRGGCCQGGDSFISFANTISHWDHSFMHWGLEIGASGGSGFYGIVPYRGLYLSEGC